MTAALALVTDGAGEETALLLGAYRRRLEAANRSERTIRGYEDYLAGLAAHAGVPLDEVTTGQVEAFLGAARRRVEKSRGRGGDATAAAAFRAVRAFYTWAEAAELVDRSPVRTLTCPRVDRKVVPVPETDALQALLASMAGKSFTDRRDTAIVRMGCEIGGPRRAELAGIRTGELDMRRSKVLLHGKGGKDRWMPFGARTGEALLRYLTARKKEPRAASPMLWLSDAQGKGHGAPLTGDGIRQMLQRRSAAAGTGHVHAHMLRHYAAAQAKRNRVPTAAAQALFGWDTPQMYDTVYGKWADADNAAQLARELAIGDQL